MTAFMLFLHPVLIGYCTRNGADIEARLRKQIRFTRKALVRAI
jgi:hypothetical protein